MAPRRSLLTLALICAAVTFSPLPCPAGYRAPDPNLFVPGADPDFHEALRQAKSAAYASIKESPADKSNAPSFDDVPQPVTASSPLALLKAYKGEPLSDRPWLSKEHASYGLGLVGTTLDGQMKAPVTQGNRLWYAERGEKELGVLPDQGSSAASSKEEPPVHAAGKPERVMLAYAGPMVGLLGPAVAAGAKAVTEAVVGIGVGAMAGAVLKKTVEKLTTPAHEPSPCETQEGFDQAAAAPSTLATPVAEDLSTARESFPAESPSPTGPTETYPANTEVPDTSRLFKEEKSYAGDGVDGWQKNSDGRWYHRDGAQFGGIPNRPNAEDAELQKAYEEIYRSENKIPGGTAGILRYEVRNNLAPRHLEKAENRLRQLQNRLTNGKLPPLSRSDRKTAERVIHDLREAIKTAKGEK